MKKYVLLYLLITLSFFGQSCSDAPEALKVGKSSLNNGAGADYDASKGFKRVDNRKPVSAFLIDEAEFKMNGVQVGLQDYLTYETPVITYFMPRNADFVEIIRCPGSVLLTSREGKLLNVEATSKTNEELSEILREVNFWKQAEESGKCTLIASEYNSSLTFHDEAASSSSRPSLQR